MQEIPIAPELSVMKFEPDYFKTVLEVINDRDFCPADKWHWIEDFTDTPERLIFHLKHYIDRQTLAGPMVTLSDDHLTKFRIELPFIENISMYNFGVPKNSTPMILKPVPVEVAPVTKVKKDPFRSMRPKYKQG